MAPIRTVVLVACLAALAGCIEVAHTPAITTSADPLSVMPGGPSAAAPTEPLTLTMIDVGWGDAILLKTARGAALIDAGTREAGRSAVLPHLEAARVERLDTLVITHAHPDHAGGCADVLRTIEVGTLVHPGRGIDHPDWHACLAEAKKQDVDVVSPPNLEEGDSLQLLPGVAATVLSIGWEGSTHHQGTAVNEGSVVLRVVHERVGVLLMGDAHCTTEQRILEAGHDVSAHILKAGHHGEENGSCDPLLEKAQPEIALVTRSTPLSEVVKSRFREHGVKAYSQKYQGTTSVTISRGAYTVETSA